MIFLTKSDVEKYAESKCKLKDQIHRDCYVSGLLAGYEEGRKTANKQRKINKDLLEEIDLLKEQLSKVEKIK